MIIQSYLLEYTIRFSITIQRWLYKVIFYIDYVYAYKSESTLSLKLIVLIIKNHELTMRSFIPNQKVSDIPLY